MGNKIKLQGQSRSVTESGQEIRFPDLKATVWDTGISYLFTFSSLFADVISEHLHDSTAYSRVI